YVDEPFWWELIMDTNLAADIYIGQVVGGNYTDLVASSLLMADYQRPTRGNLIEDIDISAANYTITGGNTYGIRFVPKELSPITNINSHEYQISWLYSIEHSVLDSNAADPRADVFYDNYYISDGSSDGIRSIGFDSTRNFSMYPNITLRGIQLSGASQDYNKCVVNVLAVKPDGSTESVYSAEIDNTYFDATNSDEQYRWPKDGKDFT